MNVAELTRIARDQQDYVVEERRKLHAMPELRWQEENTLTAILYAAREMDKWAITEMLGGVVFDYVVAEGLPWRLFRADVDALPIQEDTGLEFASQIDGVMHACGHDVHAAMLLGAMRAISLGLVTPTCNIRFVFQRAEENPGLEPIAMSGGDSLVREGVLNGIATAHMLHIWVNGESGVFSSRPGAMLGNSGRIGMKIRATGGHAAMPHNGSNALRITHRIQSLLDSFAARTLAPTEPVAMEPVILKAGMATNVMPAEAELWYGCRTMLNRDDHAKFMRRLTLQVKRLVSGFAGASVKFRTILGHPALVNNELDYQWVRELLQQVNQPVKVEPQVLGGEDFAHYLYEVPGSAWFLGANQKGCGDHHTPTFNPDQTVFWKGVLFWLLLATS